MATTVDSGTRASAPEQRFLLRGVGWEGYEMALKMVGDRRIRITYDRGDLELMSPSLEHEKYRDLLGVFIRHVTFGLRIPCRGAGSTTWRRRAKDRGLEADTCFYLASFPQVRGKGLTQNKLVNLVLYWPEESCSSNPRGILLFAISHSPIPHR